MQTSKRLNIEYDKAMHTYTAKDIYKITKRLRTVDEVEQYFQGFLSFIDTTEQQ